MEAVTEYAYRKSELEEKVRSLEAEKNSLLSEIAALKERMATLELERTAKALESEVEGLRSEKASLEDKVSGYSPESAAPEEPQPSVEGYPV